MPVSTISLPRLEIYLLGAPHVRRGGSDGARHMPPKAQALLYYLAATGHTHTRAALAHLLWSEHGEAEARSNLRKAIQELRRHFDPYLAIEYHSVGFVSPQHYWADAIEFCTGASQPPVVNSAQHQAALDLYRADFLDGFHVRDAPEFETWLLGERARLHELMVQRLSALAVHNAAEGDLAHAIAYMRRLLQVEPWREEGHRQLMTWLAQTGQRNAALLQYDVCCHALAEELGVEPEKATRELHAKLLQPEMAAPPAGPQSTVAAVVMTTAQDMAPLGFLQAAGGEAVPALCVARERELAQLDTHLVATINGSGRIVFITGEAGRGKTTLMVEFARRAQERFSDLVVAYGNCDAYAGAGDPYLPFRDVLALLGGDVEARWKAGALSQEQARRLWSLLPQTVQALADHGPDLLDVFVALPALLRRYKAAAPQGAGSWMEVLTRLEQRQARPVVAQQRQLFEQYNRVLSALATRHPLLLVLDDLQWTDTASAGLLYHLGRRLSGSRVLILGAYRPSEVPLLVAPEDGAEERHPLAPIVQELKRRNGDIEIELSGRAPETGRAFVGALLDQVPNRLDEPFREALFQRTQGHPLFTVELLREMAARHDLVRDETGCWVRGPEADWEALPLRVEAVIARRIGRLPLQVQEALKVASVEGETFTAEVVARVQGVDEPQLVRQLGSVVDRQHRLVGSLGSERLGEQLLSRYRFGHILFQNYLYKALDAAERVYLHEAVGRALEALYGEQAEQVAVQLAHHFQMTGLTAKAVDYLHQAGVRAARLSAHKEALVHLSTGLSLLAGLPPSPECTRQELSLQVALAVSFAAVKGWPAPETGQSLTRARVLSQQVEDMAQLGFSLRGLHAYYSVKGELRTSSLPATECLRVAQAQNDPVLLVVGHFAVATPLFHLGELEAARWHLEQALTGYQPAESHEYLARYGLDYGVFSGAYAAHVAWYMGCPDLALRYSQDAVALAEEADHPYSQAVAQSYAAMLHQFRREPHATQAWAESVLALGAEHGFSYYAAWATVLRGWAVAEQGESEAGIAQMQQGLAALRAVGAGLREPYYLGLLAEAHGRTGRVDTGLALLDEALALVYAHEEGAEEAETYRLRGELLWRRGADAHEVENWFLRASTVARKQRARSLELRAVTSLGRLWQQQGKAAAARQQLAACYHRFTEGHDTCGLREARDLLHELEQER